MAKLWRNSGWLASQQIPASLLLSPHKAGSDTGGKKRFSASPPNLAQGPTAVGQILHVSDYLRILIRILWGGLHPLWTGPRCSTVVRLACIPVRSQLPFRSWPQKALVMCPCACCLWSGLPLSVHLAEIHSSFSFFFGLTTWHVGILVLWPGIEPVPSPAVEAPEVRFFF